MKKLLLGVIGAVVLLVIIGALVGPESQTSRQQTDPAGDKPMAAVAAPAFEIVGQKDLNAAHIYEVATAAPTAELERVAASVMAADRSGASILRVFFYFPGETPGEILPRYRVEMSSAGTRSDDSTEQRRIAGLRIE